MAFIGILGFDFLKASTHAKQLGEEVVVSLPDQK